MGVPPGHGRHPPEHLWIDRTHGREIQPEPLGHLAHLDPDVARGLEDGAATHHRAPAPPGALAVGQGVRVAIAHGDQGRIYAEGGGGHLRERGLVTLPL